MNKIWKHIIFITLISLFIAFTGFLVFYPVPLPPSQEMEIARYRLAEAVKTDAETYSDSLFNEAQRYYDSAMTLWQRENEKFLYSRNYEKVTLLAEISADKAIEAREDSKINTVSLRAGTGEKINIVKKTLLGLSRRFSNYPLPSEMRMNVSRGDILVSEAENAMEKGLVAEAYRKISEAEQLIVPAYEYADASQRNYFRSFPLWKQWVDTTIAGSKTNQDYSIIVDKYSRKVIVYLNGEVQFTCSAELGQNWVGDKKIRGDKATPEGMYRITKKYESDSTQYYKALMLDYPNEADSALFKTAVRKGLLPRSAAMGGMIEIHGNGGKGADWTAGCIAVTNMEMDTLFKITKIGTPVTIVGSIYELRHVMIR